MKINWKKRIFSSTYELFNLDHKIGEINEKAFTNKSYGELNSKQFEFHKKGVFNSTTEIFDVASKKVVGKITFNSWGNKSNFVINERNYEWKYDNFWGSKWSILENGVPIINYKASTTKGEIETSNTNDLLVLAGLFVYNQYAKAMIIIAISTAIIVSAN